jgi:hydroxymethylglutaryl-CoA lyase
MPNAHESEPSRGLTRTQWLICVIAAIGFAFDIYEILMLPLIVRPALLELTGAAPGSPEFQMWVGRLFYIPAFAPVVDRARSAGLAVRGYLSMCFGDPWEGDVPIAQVVSVATRLLDLGCTELSLGDTIGVGTPGQVTALIEALAAAGVGTDRIAVHFHDTYGQALANTLAALRCGVTTVDASAGGLGGCPYAESATGNLATEDLVWMLNGLGIDTGVDLAKLVQTSRWMAGHLGRPSPSRVVQALSPSDVQEVKT